MYQWVVRGLMVIGFFVCKSTHVALNASAFPSLCKAILVASSPPSAFAHYVSKRIKLPLVLYHATHFNDGEIFLKLNKRVFGKNVFVLVDLSRDINLSLIKLLILLETLKRASAKRIIVCLPYLMYARQDRSTSPLTPISSKLIANLLTQAGATHILTVDMHKEQIQGFFDIPVEHLYANDLFVPDIQKRFSETITKNQLVIATPDVGGILRARALAKALGCELAIVDKRRDAEGQPHVMHVIGNIQGKTVLLVDDIGDSTGTLCNAAQALRNNGAKAVHGYLTHGVFSRGSMEKIQQSPLVTLTVTDSLPLPSKESSPKVRQVPLASLFVKAIRQCCTLFH